MSAKIVSPVEENLSEIPESLVDLPNLSNTLVNCLANNQTVFSVNKPNNPPLMPKTKKQNREIDENFDIICSAPFSPEKPKSPPPEPFLSYDEKKNYNSLNLPN